MEKTGFSRGKQSRARTGGPFHTASVNQKPKGQKFTFRKRDGRKMFFMRFYLYLYVPPNRSNFSIKTEKNGGRGRGTEFVFFHRGGNFALRARISMDL